VPERHASDISNPPNFAFHCQMVAGQIHPPPILPLFKPEEFQVLTSVMPEGAASRYTNGHLE
jgi:hypothetical protein